MKPKGLSCRETMSSGSGKSLQDQLLFGGIHSFTKREDVTSGPRLSGDVCFTLPGSRTGAGAARNPSIAPDDADDDAPNLDALQDDGLHARVGGPVGGELDYLDDGTLTAALKARRPV